jgi:hypothetical protein
MITPTTAKTRCLSERAVARARHLPIEKHQFFPERKREAASPKAIARLRSVLAVVESLSFTGLLSSGNAAT